MEIIYDNYLVNEKLKHNRLAFNVMEITILRRKCYGNRKSYCEADNRIQAHASGRSHRGPCAPAAH